MTSGPRSSLFTRSFHKTFPAAVRGEGVWLWDREGKRYLDLAGSAAVNFIGHGVPDIADAMAEQARQLEFVHSSEFITPVAEQFAAEVLEFCGPEYRGGAVYFTSGGSEAVETALKLARQYQVEVGQAQRFQVVSRKQAYHGSTLGALAVSGNRKRREMYLPMVRHYEQLQLPYCYRCAYKDKDCGARYADEVERALHNSFVAAAFIAEPVSGATLGAAVPPNGYLQAVAESCRKRGVLFIADEVMTGMGRTGRNLAGQHWGVAPDIVVLGKGIASGYAPLGAVVAKANVVDALDRGSGAFVHGFTYNAHPVAVAAGRAVLRRIREQQLVTAAAERGARLKAGLDRLHQLPHVGDVRGIGLLYGVEFVREKKSKQPYRPTDNVAGKVAQAAMERELVVYPIQGCVDGNSGDHILLAPAATIQAEDIEWAVERLGAAIAAATGG